MSIKRSTLNKSKKKLKPKFENAYDKMRQTKQSQIKVITHLKNVQANESNWGSNKQ